LIPIHSYEDLMRVAKELNLMLWYTK
jgi:hypothetical protein